MHTRAALRRVQKQFQRQPGIGAERMALPVLCDFVVRPGVIAVGAVLWRFDGLGRIVRDQIDRNAVLHEPTQHL
jgi:hypothetical protein